MVKKVEYQVTGFDVCVPGMERLRSQSEFLLLAYVDATTRGRHIVNAWMDDIQACSRPDDFDYDAARRAAWQAYTQCVKPAFRGGKRNTWSLERRNPADEESGCCAYLYVTIPDNTESV